MKTTIELPDALAREAKALAQSHGLTLRELVVAGLRSEIARLTSPATIDFTFPTVAGRGLAIDIDPGAAIHASYELPS